MERIIFEQPDERLTKEDVVKRLANRGDLRAIRTLERQNIFVQRGGKRSNRRERLEEQAKWSPDNAG